MASTLTPCSLIGSIWALFPCWDQTRLTREAIFQGLWNMSSCLSMFNVVSILCWIDFTSLMGCLCGFLFWRQIFKFSLWIPSPSFQSNIKYQASEGESKLGEHQANNPSRQKFLPVCYIALRRLVSEKNRLQI